MYFTIEQVCRVVHAALAEYVKTTGEEVRLPWEDSPQWLKETIWNGVKAQLDSFAKGEKFDPALAHELWMREKLHQGWRYGLSKDYLSKEHPCLMLYPELPVEHQIKDRLFGAIVEAFWTQKGPDKV